MNNRQTQPRANPRAALQVSWRLLPLLAAVLLMSACGAHRGSLVIDAPTRAVRIEPTLRTSVYRHIDANTADLFLSDLPEQSLTTLGEEPGATGVVVHIHLYMHPKAGRTPIDFDASNTSITVYVFANGAMGVYGGGGFLLPSAHSGDERFAGRIDGATVRLISSTPGFADRVGVGTLAGRVSAQRNDESALLISRRLTRASLLTAAPPSGEGEHATP